MLGVGWMVGWLGDFGEGSMSFFCFWFSYQGDGVTRGGCAACLWILRVLVCVFSGKIYIDILSLVSRFYCSQF